MTLTDAPSMPHTVRCTFFVSLFELEYELYQSTAPAPDFILPEDLATLLAIAARYTCDQGWATILSVSHLIDDAQRGRGLSSGLSSTDIALGRLLNASIDTGTGGTGKTAPPVDPAVLSKDTPSVNTGQRPHGEEPRLLRETVSRSGSGGDAAPLPVPDNLVADDRDVHARNQGFEKCGVCGGFHAVNYRHHWSDINAPEGTTE